MQFNLDEIISKIHNSDPEIQFDAVYEICNLLCYMKNPPINDLISRGILPILVDFLQSKK
jgi:hypothetical protein